MPDEPERNYYVESIAILSGESMMLPEKAHLEALQEHHECSLIQISNQLETLKRDVLGRP
jgi:hypothetical protein